jgi:two-component system chemotaxis response regulator CheB
MTDSGRRIRVLVVDDSALVQRVLTDELSKEPDIDVVGCAVDPYVARDKVVQLAPDVITLDIEMPRMDGLTFLEKLMVHRPTPVVVVSSLAPERGDVAMRALALGAVEVVGKPGSQLSVPDVPGRLANAIRAAAVARILPRDPSTARPVAPSTPLITTDKVVCIGASTGGTRALETLLAALPADAPPVVIVQHMPSGFTKPFADRLASVCAMKVREARDGDALSAGVALVAPAGVHSTIARSGGHYVVRVRDGAPVNFQRPAVDVLFQGAAKAAGPNAVGVLLTGMGSDGAHGLLAMREAGAFTIAEDQSTCVVFGMPRAAIELGAAESVLPLSRIANKILSRFASAPTGRGQAEVA